jgi:predicted RND superfamily exporter protein
MSPARTPFESWVVRYAQWISRYRWPVVIATLLAVVGLALGAGNLGLSSNYRVFFSPDNPDLAAFEKVQNIYTKNDNILFVVTPAVGDVFTPQTLAAVEELTEQAWQIPYSIRVDSITNFQHSEAEEDDLIVEDLVSGAAGYTRTELEGVREIALARPELKNRLIASDSRVTGVNVTLQFPGESEAELPAAVGKAREIAAAIEAEHPHLEIRMTGMAMLNTAFVESGMRDMQTIIPLMFLVLTVAIVVLVRSISGTISTFGVIAMSAASAMGIAGWVSAVFAGGKLLLSPVALQAPTMILTMAIADSIHILVSMQSEIGNGRSKREALVESLRINFVPVMLTSLTTAIGFLSMNFSDSPPLRHLGNITAAGVTVAFLLSITFLPAAMAILPVKVRRRAENAGPTVFDRLGDFVVAKRKPLLWGASALVLLLAAAVPMNVTADEYVKYFDESIAFRTDTDYTIANLTGIYSFQMSIDSGEPGGISDPEYLRILDEFAEWLRGHEPVVQVSTLTDTMRRLNMNLHGDDPRFYRIPDERELAAQYLLLYEMSLPYGLDLNNQINVDKSSTRVVVTVAGVPTNEFLALAEGAEDWLKYNGPYRMNAIATGPAVMFSRITERNIRSMVFGTALAFLLISGVLTMSLKSFRLGALSIVPNLVPALMAFGAWGLTVGKVGFSVSVVAAMTMGIVVDDTVHFLSKYLRARREKNLGSADAVRYAFSTVGKALWVTSAVLVAGFLVLSQSTFKQNADMGLLAALTITFALLADFFLLPQLLMLIDRKESTFALDKERLEFRPAALDPQPAYATQSRRREQTMKRTTTSLALIFALIASSVVAADSIDPASLTPEEAGLAIAEERDARDLGFHDFRAELRMVLKNRHGETSERSLRSQTLEQQADGDKSLVVFDAPADIDGTALLTFSHKTGDDDQWLYLPALKRVKRISSSNKSGPFVGSEFAYEDISSQEVEEYTYRFLREEELDGRSMFVIEQYPVDPKSGYTRQVAWVDQEEYRTFKVDFYDRKDALLKTLTYEGYEQHLGKHWRPGYMQMVNHQTGKSTELHWESYEFQIGLEEGDFNRAALARAR